MAFYQVVFSPTGGTAKVSDILSKALGNRCTTVDLTAPEGVSAPAFTSEDVCIIAVPVFGGRVPAVAAQRLGRLSGNGARAIAVVVYGNRAFEDALLELSDLAREAGFTVVAGISAVARHSIAGEFGQGRPDQEDEACLSAMADALKKRLSGPAAAPDLPGNHPYRIYNPLPIPILVSDRCTACGQCAARCPVGAIDKADPSRTDTNLCISCMRCIAECPQGARSADPGRTAALREKIAAACAQRKPCVLY